MEKFTNLTENLSREWILGGQILHYIPSEITPSLMKIWSNDIVKQLKLWTVERRPRLFLFSLLRPGVSIPFMTLTQRNVQNLGLTIEGREQIELYLQDNPQIKVKLAVVLPLSVSGGIVRKYRHETLNPIETEIFSEQKDAVDWLLSQIH